MAIESSAGAGALRPLPQGPVLEWSNFQMVDAPGIASVNHLQYKAFTTSGRAAIYQALLQLHLPAGSTVLVPTYHCPTMVAPALLANLRPAFFGLCHDGRPKLETIAVETARSARAMLVSHYFGLARGLEEVRQWCDQHGIALIEDCAHCFFGLAGTRAVGMWGDYATASVAKFWPIPEGGLLGSAHHPILDIGLKTRSIAAQIKGCTDALELASNYRRLGVFNDALAQLFSWKNTWKGQEPLIEDTGSSATPSIMRDCDMRRVALAPLWASRLLKSIVPCGRIIRRRQENFARFARHFERVAGARALFGPACDSVAPYVFPLWVDDADTVYPAIRRQRLPVFRWDRVWPGTPDLEGDVAPQWRRHVLQLVCHQDLRADDIDRTASAILALLDAPSAC